MFVVLMVIINVWACKDDDTVTPTEPEVTVKFGVDFALPENSDEKEVVLSFSKPARQAGKIKISLSTATPAAFQITPAVINGFIELMVEEGDAAASFHIKPVDNDIVEADRVVELDITTVSDGFKIGNKPAMTITITDDQNFTTVNFASPEGILHESNDEGLTVSMPLSTPAPQSGKVIVQIADLPAGTIFTNPGINTNGKIDIAFAAGAEAVTFKVAPIDDTLLKGHKTIRFSIESTEGPVVKGERLSFDLSLMDDELLNKAKSYEQIGGSWRSKKTYEYDEAGRIVKIHWETHTPMPRTGTDTYTYAANGLIEKVTTYPDHEEVYIQENGKIVRSERFDEGVKKEYNLFEYDAAGNVGLQVNFLLQPEGGYKHEFTFVYLYFEDGNIFKQLVYTPGLNGEDDVLISTRTYDDYKAKINPFPGFEVIPGIGGQPNLPGSFREEGNGADLFYLLHYNYREDGLPIQRTTQGPGTPEVTTYEYY